MLRPCLIFLLGSAMLLVVTFWLLPVFEVDTPPNPRADVPPACTAAGGLIFAFLVARRSLRWWRAAAGLRLEALGRTTLVPMFTRYLLLSAVLLGTAPGAIVHAQSPTPVPIQTKAHWQALLRHVHVGMSRAHVERILGHSFAADTDAPPELSRRPGGAHTALYVLDSAWCAGITFDWRGYDPDERRNPYGVLHLYKHRVIARPVLLVRDAALDARLHP